MDLITIIGLCLVDADFLAALLRDPVGTAKRYGFVLTAYELALLRRWLENRKCTEAFSAMASKYRDECPVWPCDDLRLSDFIEGSPKKS